MSKTKTKVFRVLFNLSNSQQKRGLSMAEVCRAINLRPVLFCGRRLCGFPNPRKRATMTLFKTNCSPKYSTVCASIRSLRDMGEVTVKTEMKYDVIKKALDPRRMVRLSKKERLV